jgi:hypothetical protein
LSRGAALLAAFLAGGAAAADSTDINLGACLKSAGFAEALLTRTASGAWLAVATLDSFGVKVLVDPRAPYTFLDATTLKKLGYGLTPGRRDVTFDGTREPLYRVPLANFALGGLNADSVWFDVTRIDAVARAAGLDQSVAVAGIIGGDMLRRCDALLDMEHDRLFLRTIRPAPVDTVEARYRKPRGKTEATDTLFGELERRLRKRESAKGGSVDQSKTGQEQEPQGGGEADTSGY